MKNLIFLLIIYCSTNNLIAQNQFNNWYFGNNSGITFNTPDREPIVLNDGKTNTLEGCSSISDRSGNLLFYTDGVTVWNKKHQIMKNGEDLYGHTSSTQSAIIVPKPGSYTIYYIFTADADFYIQNNPKGIHFSTVDISMEGGLGEVVRKNEPLLKTRSEKMTAVIHKNNVDVWLICQDTEKGNFSVFQVTKQGVITSPITSNCTLFLDSYQIGNIKLSNDTKKLAVSHFFTRNGLLLYDFDNLTGLITNEIVFTLPREGAYGVEFSRNRKYLYVNAYIETNNIRDYTMYQLDLTNYDSLSIIRSIYRYRDSARYNGSLQIGPNGKIYANVGNHLTVIHNPDAKCPDCLISSKELFMNNNTGTLGLPSEVQGYRNPRHFTLCAGDNLFLYSFNLFKGEVTWTGPNGFSSTKSNPYLSSISTDMSGKYYYTIQKDSQIIDYDSVIVNVDALEKILFKDSIIIETDKRFYKLKAVDYPDKTKFKWYGIDSDKNEVFITKSGRYSVVTENESGCKDSASVIVKFNPKYCPGEDIELDFLFDDQVDSNTSYQYFWSGPKGFTSSERYPILKNVDNSMAGTYNLEIIKTHWKDDVVDDIDTFYLKIPVFIFGRFGLNLTADKLFACENDPVNIFPNLNFNEYLWSTGEKTSYITAKKPGIYKLFVTNDYGCTDSAEIEIKYYEPIISYDVQNIIFDEICVGETQTKTLTITNENVDKFTISEIMTKTSNFQININKSILKKGESAIVNITFTPQDGIILNDELIINSDSPCNYNFSIPIFAQSKQGFLFSITEVKAVPGEIIEIPINAKIQCQAPSILNTDYELTIKIDKEYFKPDSIKSGEITFNQIVDGNRIIKISSSGNFYQNESEINRISGLALKGRKEKVNIHLEDAKFSNPKYNYELKDGSLLIEACLNNLNSLIMFVKTTLKVSPNPNDGTMNITIGTQEEGAHNLLIVDLQGREIFQKNIIKNGRNFENFEIEINSNNLPKGIYYLKLKSPWSENFKKVIISK